MKSESIMRSAEHGSGIMARFSLSLSLSPFSVITLKLSPAVSKRRSDVQQSQNHISRVVSHTVEEKLVKNGHVTF